jgi:hypothetical protein
MFASTVFFRFFRYFCCLLFIGVVHRELLESYHHYYGAVSFHLSNVWHIGIRRSVDGMKILENLLAIIKQDLKVLARSRHKSREYEFLSHDLLPHHYRKILLIKI